MRRNPHHDRFTFNGSVFVTPRPMAPTATTATIAANALRSTERLIERARLQRVAG